MYRSKMHQVEEIRSANLFMGCLLSLNSMGQIVMEVCKFIVNSYKLFNVYSKIPKLIIMRQKNYLPSSWKVEDILVLALKQG